MITIQQLFPNDSQTIIFEDNCWTFEAMFLGTKPKVHFKSGQCFFEPLVQAVKLRNWLLNLEKVKRNIK